jgi:hypothetical protein
MTNRPYVFRSVDEALQALRADRLGTIYFRAHEVFVATAFGTGTFPRSAWKAAGGPESLRASSDPSDPSTA